MVFFSFRCKLLLDDWCVSTKKLSLRSEVFNCIDHFTYLRSRISSFRLFDENSKSLFLVCQFRSLDPSADEAVGITVKHGLLN